MPAVTSRLFLVIASLCVCAQLLRVAIAGHGGESSETLNYLVHIYDTLQERMSDGHANLLDNSEGFANTAHCLPSEQGTGAVNGDIRFNLSEIKTTEEIVSAMLVFKQPAAQYMGRIKLTSSNNGRELLSETSLDTHSIHSGWMEVKIRVTSSLGNWNPASKELYVLNVDFVTEEEDRDKPSVHELHPMLVLFTQNNETLPSGKNTAKNSDVGKLEEPATVQKRQTAYTGQEEEPCKVHDKFIPYEVLNWPDLSKIEVFTPPNGIIFNYCYGHCKNQDTTTHALFLEFARLRESMTPPPCCAPTNLLPISLIYRDRGTVSARLQIFEDILVDTCGCF